MCNLFKSQDLRVNMVSFRQFKISKRVFVELICIMVSSGLRKGSVLHYSSIGHALCGPNFTFFSGSDHLEAPRLIDMSRVMEGNKKKMQLKCSQTGNDKGNSWCQISSKPTVKDRLGKKIYILCKETQFYNQKKHTNMLTVYSFSLTDFCYALVRDPKNCIQQREHQS